MQIETNPIIAITGTFNKHNQKWLWAKTRVLGHARRPNLHAARAVSSAHHMQLHIKWHDNSTRPTTPCVVAEGLNKSHAGAVQGRTITVHVTLYASQIDRQLDPITPQKPTNKHISTLDYCLIDNPLHNKHLDTLDGFIWTCIASQGKLSNRTLNKSKYSSCQIIGLGITKISQVTHTQSINHFLPELLLIPPLQPPPPPPPPFVPLSMAGTKLPAGQMTVIVG